jgi:ribonuclease T2
MLSRLTSWCTSLSRRRLILAAVGSLGIGALAISTAEAQRFPNDWFGGFPRANNPAPREKGGRGNHEAGKFDYYTLSLSWSPTYCASSPRAESDPQCNVRRGGRPFAFVLHGLWPQYNRGWPQDCASPDRGFVPRPVAQRMLDIMPSEKLVFHEYRKHGVCSGLGVDGYFDLSRQLYNKIRIPEMFQEVSNPRLFVSVDETLKAFREANPQMRPDSIAVECAGAGNRLREIRVCFDRDGQFRACGQNESQRRLCGADRMYVPPTRGDRAGPPRSTPLGPNERRI